MIAVSSQTTTRFKISFEPRCTTSSDLFDLESQVCFCSHQERSTSDHDSVRIRVLVGKCSRDDSGFVSGSVNFLANLHARPGVNSANIECLKVDWWIFSLKNFNDLAGLNGSVGCHIYG